jgi:signal transduction histidine kinase
LVNTRAQQIQQLFLNVLSNARHALGEKYPTSDKNKKIEISIITVEHDGVGYVRILFKDYGSGITKPMLERVMHPFVTTKPTGVGTGLGLSISFEIVKKHGGMFWIESVEGESTEVYIDLPVARKD